MIGTGRRTRARGARGSAASRGSLALAAMLLAGALAPAASGAVSPADRAATDAYLQAGIALYESLLANARTSTSATESLTASLERECPGVLAHAPGRAGTSGSPAPGPRAQGERDRQQQQLDALRFELSESVAAAGLAPDRAAVASYAQAVDALHWSDPTVTASAHYLATVLEEEAMSPVEDVCADMRAWVASGYRAVTAATAQARALFDVILEQALDTGLDAASPEVRVAPYEDTQGRVLAARLGRLEARTAELPPGRAAGRIGLDRALGLAEEESQPRGTVIGRGTTQPGGTYVVRVERTRPGSGPRCRFTTAIEYSSPGGGAGEVSSSYASGCGAALQGLRTGPPVSCNAGELTIQYSTPPGVRRIRLRLSDGRSLTSAVVSIPRRLGGPGGMYFQALDGPSPIPVSLSELDAHGRVLRVVRLAPLRGCTAPIPPTVVVLASAQAPGGPTFTIRGAAVGEGRRRELEVVLSGTPDAGFDERPSGPTAGRKPFRWSLRTQCAPYGAVIVYGVLGEAGASVLARTAAGLVPLSQQPVPSQLHASGALAYGAFASAPGEIVVRAADGRTLSSESLAAVAAEEAEYCAGYAE